MSAFELNNNSASFFGNAGDGKDSRRVPSVPQMQPPVPPPGHPRPPIHPEIPPEKIRTKTENIIALKIYDICRSQDCLDFNSIGPARAVGEMEPLQSDEKPIKEGQIIIPPRDAASVSMEDVHIKRIIIVDKRPSSLRRGFWDVEVKYIIGYKLIFRGINSHDEKVIDAFSMYNKKLTLFGSEGGDLAIATDLFGMDGSGVFEATPFVMVEAKAMGLCSSLIYDSFGSDHSRGHGHGHGHDHDHHEGRRRATSVEVVIGLFSIVKLFRLVDLAVESTGFTIPGECEEICPMDPCEFFNGLAFPMDLFAPPQKREFDAGVSSNIAPRGVEAALEVE